VIRRAGICASLCAFLVLCGCSAGDDSAQPAPTLDDTATQGADALRSPAAGCGLSPRAAGDTNAGITSGGIERTYILHIPPQYDGTTALPLVLNLHGYGSNAERQAVYSSLPAKADEAGFIVATPNGSGAPQFWNNANVGGSADDVQFMEDLVDKLTEDLCIDGTRIYATGISNGAAMSQRLACDLPERIAGIAAVAFTFKPLVCGSRTPVPVIAFHGTEDACVPFEGGPVTCGRGSAGFALPSTEASAANWAAHNGCNPVPSTTQVTEHVRAVAYSECRDEVAVILYIVEGGGHTWPGAADVARLGTVTQEIDATDLIWEFFEAQAALR
jgi:polyhydroxybutyrate depolymerase